VKFDQVYWAMDQRFDFLLDSFAKKYEIQKGQVRFVRSYFGRNQYKDTDIRVGDAKDDEIVYLEPEDINIQLNNLLLDLPVDRRILLVSFTGAYISSSPNIKTLISVGSIAKELNSKWQQYLLLDDMRIKTPKTWRANDSENLKNLVLNRLNYYPKLVIKMDELSGGYKMKSITSSEQLGDYTAELDSKYQNGPFHVSEYIEHKQSFAGMGIVTKDGVNWCGATEQVLYNDFAYEGLIWPPFASESDVSEMKKITIDVGRELKKKGYLGFYNVDFIKGDLGLYAVEINTRFGFGTILYALFCGDSFWDAVEGNITVELPFKENPENRYILGKIKGKFEKKYSNLNNEPSVPQNRSDDTHNLPVSGAPAKNIYANSFGIVEWFSGKQSHFKTYFAGTGKNSEIFMYGSFIGLFGKTLDGHITRNRVLRDFWSDCLCQFKGQKKLLSMYVDDFCGIQKTTFNFDITAKYRFEDGGTVSKLTSTPNGFPKDFWGKAISSMTLMIGENGSGKTTILRLLCIWLCQLAVGKIPAEKGALLLSSDGREYITAFEERKLRKPDNIGELTLITDIHDIQSILSDVEVVYYSDTMSDLELDNLLSENELNYLKNESLIYRLTHLSESFGSQIFDVRRQDFFRHIEMYLDNIDDPEWHEPFPLQYIRLSLTRPGYFYNVERTRESYFAVYDIPALLNRLYGFFGLSQDFLGCLIWTVIADVISSSIILAGEIPFVDNERVAVDFSEFLRRDMFSPQIRDYPLNRKLDLISSIINESESILNEQLNRPLLERDSTKETSLMPAYRENCSRMYSSFRSFLDSMKSIEEGKGIWSEIKELKADKRESGLKEIVYLIKLDALEKGGGIKNWQSLFDNYLHVSSFMPDFKLTWHYGSSGENNRGAFYNILSLGDKLAGRKGNVWYFLDEIDNAYHPEWKRTAIKQLVSACNNSRNTNLNFQLWISTHSPIMLSDSPKDSSIFMQKNNNGNTKKLASVHRSTFGQQIYTLFDDAFFMKEGIIGQYADEKIASYYQIMKKIERKYRSNRKVSERARREDVKALEAGKYLLQLVDEPLLKGHLEMAYRTCIRLVASSNKRDG